MDIYLCMDFRRSLCRWINFVMSSFWKPLWSFRRTCICVFGLVKLVKCLFGDFFGLHVLGNVSSYTCLGIYLLMDFSMLSRWPCLCTPSLSQSWLPSAASLYPFTLFCRKAA